MSSGVDVAGSAASSASASNRSDEPVAFLHDGVRSGRGNVERDAPDVAELFDPAGDARNAEVADDKEP